MAPDPPKGYAPFDLYPYNPSPIGGYVFLFLFSAAALTHLIMMIPYRVWFTLPMVVGCCFEAGGYFMRTMSHDDVRKILPFVVQNLLIMAAPPLLAAPIFMAPRRIANVLESTACLTSPRLLPKLFILVDLVCLITQTAGAIMSGSEDPNEAHQGELLIKIGLIVQLVAISAFLVWLASFHMRLNKFGTPSELMERLSWRRVVWGLYVIALLFIMRTVTRLIEYAQGHDGPMLSNEIYLYVLDAVVMWAIAVLLAALHPGRLKFQARRFNSKLRLDRLLCEDERMRMEDLHSARR